MLRRMAWSSIPSTSFQVARLHEIVACARYNNERHHISGMLLFTGAHFLSLLEGSEWDLAGLWPKLTRDERHCGLHRIGDELCGVRWFPVWKMAYLDNSEVGARIETLRSPEREIGPLWAQALRPMMLSADAM